jgi:hypothetical protein
VDQYAGKDHPANQIRKARIVEQRESSTRERKQAFVMFIVMRDESAGTNVNADHLRRWCTSAINCKCSRSKTRIEQETTGTKSRQRSTTEWNGLEGRQQNFISDGVLEQVDWKEVTKLNMDSNRWTGNEVTRTINDETNRWTGTKSATKKLVEQISRLSKVG